MKGITDEYLLKRANAMRNILQGETTTIGEAAVIAWLLIASFALDAAEHEGERAAELVLGEAGELAADLRAGRISIMNGKRH
jgi:hypothetical protein